MDSYLEDIRKDVVKDSTETRVNDFEIEKYKQELDEQAKLSLISLRRWIRFFGILTIILLGVGVVLSIIGVKLIWFS